MLRTLAPTLRQALRPTLAARVGTRAESTEAVKRTPPPRAPRINPLNLDKLPKRRPMRLSDQRKTYLIDLYSEYLRSTPVILFAQNNAISKTDSRNLRHELLKSDARLKILRGAIFKKALKTYKELDPASELAHFNTRKDISLLNIRHLISGPSSVILFKEINPKQVKDVLKVVKKLKESLFITGAKVGDMIMDLNEIDQFKELPTLTELQSQVLGVLTMAGGGALTQALETTPQLLSMTMEARREMLAPKDEKSD